MHGFHLNSSNALAYNEMICSCFMTVHSYSVLKPDGSVILPTKQAGCLTVGKYLHGGRKCKRNRCEIAS